MNRRSLPPFAAFSKDELPQKIHAAMVSNSRANVWWVIQSGCHAIKWKALRKRRLRPKLP